MLRAIHEQFRVDVFISNYLSTCLPMLPYPTHVAVPYGATLGPYGAVCGGFRGGVHY